MQGESGPLKRRARRGEATAWIFDNVGYSGDDCLIWPFARNGAGYGNVLWEGRFTVVSRVMCRLKRGEPNDVKDDAAHSCGNGHRGCVNPNHLRWATRVENSADTIAHGRTAKGEKNGNVKISETNAADIRSGLNSIKHYIDKYGISYSQVVRIIKGERWQHL